MADFLNDLLTSSDLELRNDITEDTEFIPLLTTEDEEFMNNEQLPDLLSILPLRNTVLFPGVVIPITVGRDKSIKLIKEAYTGTKIIGVVAQKDDKIEDPSVQDLNNIGTVAYILKMLRMPDGNTTVIIQGKRRFEVEEVVEIEPFFKARVKAHSDIKPKTNDSCLRNK